MQTTPDGMGRRGGFGLQQNCGEQRLLPVRPRSVPDGQIFDGPSLCPCTELVEPGSLAVRSAHPVLGPTMSPRSSELWPDGWTYGRLHGADRPGGRCAEVDGGPDSPGGRRRSRAGQQGADGLGSGVTCRTADARSGPTTSLRTPELRSMLWYSHSMPSTTATTGFFGVSLSSYSQPVRWWSARW